MQSFFSVPALFLVRFPVLVDYPCSTDQTGLPIPVPERDAGFVSSQSSFPNQYDTLAPMRKCAFATLEILAHFQVVWPDALSYHHFLAQLRAYSKQKPIDSL
jgi:hypothetical protein